jgi:cytochrome c peroxidase
MRKVGALLSLAALVPWAIALKDEEPKPVLPATPYNYAKLNLPAHFSGKGYYDANRMDNTPRDNLVTDEGATLGRVLFYDKRLSKNRTVSCGSCHVQKLGFTDAEALSTGFNGEKTKRSSMPIVNVRYHEPRAMFWDERAPHLEAQVLMPIQDPVEMGMTLDEVVSRLRDTDFYPPLFEAAFGTSEINSDRVSKALAQFVRSIVSYRSKYDRALTDGIENVFTAQEKLGHELFFGQPTGGDLSEFVRTGRLGRATCANCHRGNVQSGDGLRNNGLDPDSSKDPGTNGRFKSPSLRNVANRTHFMHDGRFKSLREVVEHYDSGIQPNRALDGLLRGRLKGARDYRSMTEDEIAALVAFLQTLTDEALLTDPKYSDPFVRP